MANDNAELLRTRGTHPDSGSSLPVAGLWGILGAIPTTLERRSPDRKNLAQVSYAEQSAALFLADPRYCFASAASWTSRFILFCSIRMKPVRGLSMSSNSRFRT